MNRINRILKKILSILSSCLKFLFLALPLSCAFGLPEALKTKFSIWLTRRGENGRFGKFDFLDRINRMNRILKKILSILSSCLKILFLGLPLACASGLPEALKTKFSIWLTRRGENGRFWGIRFLGQD
jgi:predicted outer membrane lipoprotein